MGTILELLRQHAETNPDAPAIGTLRRENLSYGAFLSAVLEIRGILHTHGLGPQSRIAIVAPDGPQLLFGILAVASTAQALPIGADATSAEIQDIVKRAGCAALIVHRNVEPHIFASANALDILLLEAVSLPDDPAGLWRLDALASGSNADIVDPGLSDIAFFLTSSGTTGQPKLIPRTHGNLSFCDGVLLQDLDITQRDIAVACMPQQHSMGSIGTTHPAIRAGGFAVCAEGGFTPASFIAHLEEFRPTYFSAGPVYLRAILRELERTASGSDFKHLRFIRTGTDVLPADLRAAVERKFGVQIHAAYGMSETGPIAHRSADRAADQPGFLGRLLLDNVALIGDDGRINRSEGAGEIAISGPSISPFYVGDEALNREAFFEGWLRTGDLGVIDADRNLYFAGRKKDLINRGGFKISPVEIERALLLHPSVAEAALFPIEHATLGEEVGVAIVPAVGHGFDQGQLEAHLARHLSREKCPRHFCEVDALPRNEIGKVQRDRLTEMFIAEIGPLTLDRKAIQRGPNDCFVAPRSELESVVLALWESLLDIEGIGVEDDFFNIGGDSLSATQLLMEIEKRFDWRFDAAAILNRVNTVSGMARELEVAGKGRASVPVEGEGRAPLDVDFAEFEVQVQNRARPALYFVDPETGLRRAKASVTQGSIQTNSFGFRSPEIPLDKPEGTIRIAFLGSSTTFDSEVSSNTASWPHLVVSRLQEMNPALDFDYINAGLPGFSTKPMTEHFKRYVAPLMPDIVVIRPTDLTRDTAYSAREQGIYSGVHYSMSRLAQQSTVWAKLEKNLVVAGRLLGAYGSRQKLSLQNSFSTKGYESRLSTLIEMIRDTSASTILINADSALRPGQPLWVQARAAQSYLFYMPYLSIPSILTLQKAYAEAARSVAARTGASIIDIVGKVPADRTHFVDTAHYSDAGSRLAAELISDALLTLDLLPITAKEIATSAP